tara:strand:- start:1052 stop:1204 length:153 start_codon:yes stop_codon:yes gene_type:complete
MDLKRYKKISNYAQTIGKSITWVNKLHEKKELIIVKIDGVKFVDVFSIKP